MHTEMHTVYIRNMRYPGLNPVVLGWRKCPPDHKNGPHVRPFWLLYYVVNGCGTLYFDDQSYPVKAGSLFVLPPYVQATHQADSQDPWELTWVGFRYPGALPVNLPPVTECPGAMQIFESMRSCEKRSGGRTEYLCAQLWRLFAFFNENERKETDCIDEAMSYIQAEYTEGLTVTDLAKRLKIDRSHFSCRFKQRMGVSPGKYLLKLRMEQAATMLTGGASVSVTAASVGYADIYIFSKMFRRFYGVTPTEYKKQHG